MWGLKHSPLSIIVDYCSDVWGYGRFEICNKIHNRAIRYFLGVHSKVPILAIQGDMGWVSPKYRRYLKLFMLWNHFVMLDNTRLTKQVFEWDMDRKRDNWSADMEHLFDLVDMTDIFERKSPCNLDLVSKKLFLLMQEEWEKSLPSKPKLRTYIKFKETLKTEEYVKVCLSRMQRSLLAQFRSGILPLYVETGR